MVRLHRSLYELLKHIRRVLKVIRAAQDRFFGNAPNVFRYYQIEYRKSNIESAHTIKYVSHHTFAYLTLLVSCRVSK